MSGATKSAVKEPKASGEMQVVKIQAQRLVPHPKNRQFPREGAEWEEFVESIRFRGVQLPILARPLGEDWQIVAGHRRTAAAMAAGILEVPVIVRAMSDKEAMEIVFIDNLHVVDLNAMDEALGVQGLAEVGMNKREIAQRICRDERWVATRQGILELGDVVHARMRLPKEHEKHVGVRVVEEILKAPAELREKAISLVLFPEFEEGTLSPRQAEEVIQRQLVEPWRQQVEWEAGRVKLAKGWKKRLKALCLKGTKADELVVVSVPWADTEKITRAGVGAEVKVPLEEQSADAPQFLMWLHLAVRHGQAVRIVYDPAGGQDRSFALVDQRVLIEAEEANAELLGKEERALEVAIARAQDMTLPAVEREDAARKAKELAVLVKSLVPWLVTKARGRVSRETREVESRGLRVESEKAEETTTDGTDVSDGKMRCDCCENPVSMRSACTSCGAMVCTNCTEEGDLCTGCWSVPFFLGKKKGIGERVLPEAAYTEPAGFDGPSFGDISYDNYINRMEQLIEAAGLKRSAEASRARGEWCEEYFGIIAEDVPVHFVKFAIAFHDRLGLEEHVLEDLRSVLVGWLTLKRRDQPPWLGDETGEAYNMLWGNGPFAIGYREPAGESADHDERKAPMVIDWWRVSKLHTAAITRDLDGEEVPEWAKAMEPQHVTDVISWIISLEMEGWNAVEG